jgi:hypothetical protein
MIGFDFHLVDQSQNEVPVSTVFKSWRKDGSHFMGVGVMGITLKPNFAVVSTFPLSHYYPVIATGKYLISADWANLKSGPNGLGRPTPEIKVEGTILIQPSSSGISISAAN